MKKLKNLKELSQILGGDLYIVGGYNRNALLNLPCYDVDIASSKTIDEVLKLLDGTKYIVKLKSAKMGTLEIFTDDEVYQFTTFRREVCEPNGKHEPNIVYFTKSIEEDAVRRDLTINALYYDVKSGKMLDFFGGINDLKEKQLKAVKLDDNVFVADGVRLLRSVRFASELGFRIEENTFNAIKQNAKNITNISADRKREELFKILCADEKYNIGKCFNKSLCVYGVELLVKLNLMPYMFDMKNVDFSNFVDFSYISKVSGLKNRLNCFLICVYNYIVKQNEITFEEFMYSLKGKNSLGLTNAYLKNFLNLLRAVYYSDNVANLRRYILKNYTIFDELFVQLSAFGRADLVKKLKSEYDLMKKQNIPFTISELKINGNDIKLLLGGEQKRIGKVLKIIKSECVYNGEINERENLLKLAKKIISGSVLLGGN